MAPCRLMPTEERWSGSDWSPFVSGSGPCYAAAGRARLAAVLLWAAAGLCLRSAAAFSFEIAAAERCKSTPALPT